MKIKGIYHPHLEHYYLCRELGFTHVEISRNAYPGNKRGWDSMYICLDEAHRVGLHCIIDPGFFIDLSAAKEFLAKANILYDDIVYLVDEPNLAPIEPWRVNEANEIAKELKPLSKTMISLSPTRSFSGYEDCSDIVGFVYHKKFFPDLWSLSRFSAKFLRFKILSGASLVGIPAIKYSADHINNQSMFWRVLGIKDLVWYSFTPNEEKPAWFDKDLSGLTEIKATLRFL